MLLTYAVPLTIVDESTEIVSSSVPVHGILRGFACTAGAMDGSDTYTVTFKNQEGATVFSLGSLAESTTSSAFVSKYGGTNEYAPMNLPLNGPITVTITASAEQNDAAVAFTVYIYYEG